MQTSCRSITHEFLLGDYVFARIAYQVEHWSKLIQPSDLDDMRQEIFLSLLSVAGDYDGVSASKETFTSVRIAQAVNRFVACLRRGKSRETASFEFLKEIEQPVYNDMRAGEFSVLDLIYWKIDLSWAVETGLSERQAHLCRLLLNDFTPRDVANRLRLSTSQMYREMESLRDFRSKPKRSNSTASTRPNFGRGSIRNIAVI